MHEDEAQEAAETIEIIEVRPEEPEPEPWYPPWAPWILWPVVVAALIVAFTEWPKRWLFKPTDAWKEADSDRAKAMLLSPLLLLLGAAIGTPIYNAAGLLDTLLLNMALGAATGVFAAPLYDVGIKLLGIIPKVAKRTAGVETTVDTPTVEAPDDTLPHDDELEEDPVAARTMEMDPLDRADLLDTLPGDDPG